MEPSPSAPTRQARRPRRPSADGTRRALLDAGRIRFARKGYSRTAIQDILDDVGVTVPVLYHHFGSKHGLFVAVAEDVYGRFLADLRQSVESTTGFEQAINAVLDAAQRIHASDPSLASLTLTVQIEARRDEELARELRIVLQSFRGFTDELAARAPAELIDKVDGRHLYRALAVILNGLNSIADNTGPEDFAATVDVVRHLLLEPLAGGES
ncbi:TetR/AcrR family transcriptional regulator [Nocardia sp. NPDC050175]|uniref:TetR/AcrR family transcriptional regulator n=1 Tax=Nocardia sp. NPDC050175 TaxID=3364317 RepID=UPI003791F9B8